MKNIFNLDNKFFVFMSKVADVIILNLLFIFTSIPIITIGPSLTALYSVSLKLADGKDPYIANEYFRAWKENFKQSTIVWIILLPISLLLIFNISIYTAGTAYLIMRIGMVVALIILGIGSLYVFPLLAKFENTVKQTIINAFLMSLRHFLTTCMLFGTNLFFVLVTILYPTLIEAMVMFWFLFGFALTVRIQASLLTPVFNKYINAAAETENEIETE